MSERETGELNNEALTAIEKWLEVPRIPFSARDRRILATGATSVLPFEDAELSLTQWGQARQPLALLVHGWGGHRAQLGAFVQPLEKAGYRVAAFDGPAHGDTPGTQTTGYQMAAALQAVVARLGQQPQLVIAHSFGAMAVNIALQRGLQVQKIVFSGALRRLSDALDAYMRANGYDEDVAAQVEAETRRRYGEDVWEVTALDLQLPRFDIPALLIHDQDDETTPYMSSVAIARAWPNARLLSTNGLGHRLVLRSKEVVQQVMDFINE